MAKNIQITPADRTALKTCYQPLTDIFNSVFSPEMINKLRCAATVLQIPATVNIPSVENVFPETSQTTSNTPDCSQYQFEGMSREDVIQAISGEVTNLTRNLYNPEVKQAMKQAISCALDISNKAAGIALNSYLEQQGQMFDCFFQAVNPTSSSGELTINIERQNNHF